MGITRLDAAPLPHHEAVFAATLLLEAVDMLNRYRERFDRHGAHDLEMADNLVSEQWDGESRWRGQDPHAALVALLEKGAEWMSDTSEHLAQAEWDARCDELNRLADLLGLPDHICQVCQTRYDPDRVGACSLCESCGNCCRPETHDN